MPTQPRQPTYDLAEGLLLFRWGDEKAQIKKHYPDATSGETDMFASLKVWILEHFLEVAPGLWLQAQIGPTKYGDQALRLTLAPDVDASADLAALQAGVVELAGRLGKRKYAWKLDKEDKWKVGLVEASLVVDPGEPPLPTFYFKTRLG
jgi:hypothetical protein